MCVRGGWGEEEEAFKAKARRGGWMGLCGTDAQMDRQTFGCLAVQKNPG